ncbi:DUF2784 domain-containing protein [Algoriphagus aestuariicola]|uniref:DUF2784 domain-containing protein n=1 Tax=Algoriphagus aestuariicola TaxID=1852016 RepID=A0ABS3BK07_9BACT|nr:DUF2784 domain-containing protein [Algoriphagus aestuariicola]MBN7799493.1 DUF2784 domain-containing protein [Algoriphagus aestuariicola]
MWLNLLDYFLTVLHLLIIGLNLLGWIWPTTRRLHLWCVLMTAASWLGLGIWFGIGYCPLTDWQWQVKSKLGETDLPNSFIKYWIDRMAGIDADPVTIDVATAISFALVFLIAIYHNILKKRKPKSS